MGLTKPLLLVVLLFVATKARKRTQAVNYLGVGYNLIDGNPEGVPSNGNVDPGLKSTHRMLKLTYLTGRRTHDDKIMIPDQASFTPRLSCSSQVQTSSYHGAKGYQRKLQVSVKTSVSGNYGLFGFSFTASAMFNNFKKGSSKSTNINTEERRVCNRGMARYLLENAGLKNSNVKLEEGFVADIKRLPARFDRRRYGQFLDRWGTHVVDEVTVGSIHTKVTSITKQEAFKYALRHSNVGLSVSGRYGGTTGSVAVNVDRLTQDQSFQRSFSSKSHEFSKGSTITFRNGKWVLPRIKSFPEPIQIKIVTIDKIMNSRFTSDAGVHIRLKNMQKALREYHIYRSLHKLNNDGIVRLPVAWPKGTYGLVRTRSSKSTNGCPSGNNALFKTGYRIQDTENSNPKNRWSRSFYLYGGKTKSYFYWEFCIKVSNNKNTIDHKWPRGKYCIFQAGGSCPKGFRGGAIYWDDENHRNGNKHGGTLPDGHYTANTLMYFCCRNDGSTATPIILPTNRPFILMPTQRGRLCQSVFGMKVSRQWFHWDDENRRNRSYRRGFHPYDVGGKHDHTLVFCYYY